MLRRAQLFISFINRSIPICIKYNQPRCNFGALNNEEKDFFGGIAFIQRVKLARHFTSLEVTISTQGFRYPAQKTCKQETALKFEDYDSVEASYPVTSLLDEKFLRIF